MHRLVKELIRWIIDSSTTRFAKAQTCQWTTLLHLNLVSELIRWRTDSSANSFAEAQARQPADQLKHKLVILLNRCELIHSNASLSAKLVTWSRQWNDLLHRILVSTLIRCIVNLSANRFREAQTCQRTDSVMHILFSKLIRYTTQPRQWKDLLEHIVIREQILWSKDSFANW